MGDIKPKTKLEDLVNFYKEIKATNNIFIARIEAGIDKKKAFSFLKEQEKIIEGRYGGILHEEDRYSFNSLDEMKKFMKASKICENEMEIDGIIKHEKAHYEKAIQVGGKFCGFSLWLAIDKNKEIGYLAVTTIRFNKINHEDYKKIMKAPKEPSLLDEI